MNKKNRSDKQKKKPDIWQIIFVVSLAVSLPSLSSLFPDVIPSIFISGILAGLGGGIGVLIAFSLKNRSTIEKVIVFSCCIVSVFLLIFFNTPQNKEQLFSKTLVEISNSLNEQCPIILDRDTRLDTTLAGPGDRLSYFYTLVNFKKDEINAEQLIKVLKPNILNNAKTNKDMESFRKNKVELVYIYRDKENKEAFRIVLLPNEYI